MEPINPEIKSTRRQHRWSQYSLRTLLVLVTGAAVALGIYMHSVRRQQQAVAEILAAGGDVVYEDSGSVDSYSSWLLRLDGTGYDATRSRPPQWLEGLIGRDFTSRVVGVSFVGKSQGIRYPRNFRGPPGPKVNPWYPDPEPEQMVHISGVVLQGIGSLRNLTSLYLAETDVDDQGVECLRTLPRLRYVALGNLVSENGYRRLRKALPKADIDY